MRYTYYVPYAQGAKVLMGTYGLDVADVEVNGVIDAALAHDGGYILAYNEEWPDVSSTLDMLRWIERRWNEPNIPRPNLRPLATGDIVAVYFKERQDDRQYWILDVNGWTELAQGQIPEFK